VYHDKSGLMMAVETPRTTSTVATKQDVNELAGKLDKVVEYLSKNKSALIELIQEMRELQKSQQKQYEDMTCTLHSSTKEVKSLRSENQDLKDRVQQLDDAFCLKTQKAINDLEQCGWWECLEFQGLVQQGKH